MPSTQVFISYIDKNSSPFEGDTTIILMTADNNLQVRDGLLKLSIGQGTALKTKVTGLVVYYKIQLAVTGVSYIPVFALHCVQHMQHSFSALYMQ